MVKKFKDIFIRFGATHERDGHSRTDGHRMHRAVKMSRVIKPDSCDVQIFSPGHKFNQYFGNIDNRNLLQGR